RQLGHGGGPAGGGAQRLGPDRGRPGHRRAAAADQGQNVRRGDRRGDADALRLLGRPGRGRGQLARRGEVDGGSDDQRGQPGQRGGRGDRGGGRRRRAD